MLCVAVELYCILLIYMLCQCIWEDILESAEDHRREAIRMLVGLSREMSDALSSTAARIHKMTNRIHKMTNGKINFIAALPVNRSDTLSEL